MRKLLFFLLLIACVVPQSRAQDNRRIKYRADMGLYDEDFMPGAQRLIGNVAFAQDNVRGYCDSAYLFDADNYIIAFGDKVRIFVGDSVRLYGRRAYYDGDEKTASIAMSVRLEKGSAYLLSDSLIYNTAEDVGYYVTGGKLVNDKYRAIPVRPRWSRRLQSSARRSPARCGCGCKGGIRSASYPSTSLPHRRNRSPG